METQDGLNLCQASLNWLKQPEYRIQRGFTLWMLRNWISWMPEGGILHDTVGDCSVPGRNEKWLVYNSRYLSQEIKCKTYF